jgi:hypothetical protein
MRFVPHSDECAMAHETSIEALNQQPSPMAARQFEIEFFAPGVEALTFTFG